MFSAIFGMFPFQNVPFAAFHMHFKHYNVSCVQKVFLPWCFCIVFPSPSRFQHESFLWCHFNVHLPFCCWAAVGTACTLEGKSGNFGFPGLLIPQSLIPGVLFDLHTPNSLLPCHGEGA